MQDGRQTQEALVERMTKGRFIGRLFWTLILGWVALLLVGMAWRLPYVQRDYAGITLPLYGGGRAPRPEPGEPAGRLALARPAPAPGAHGGASGLLGNGHPDVGGRGRPAWRRSVQPRDAPVTPASRTPALRSLAAVLGGYLIFAFSAVALFQLSGRDPHAPQPLWFAVASVAYGMAFAALGGFVAARLAPARARLHAAGVALVLALGATVSLVASPGGGATWSQWAALALMAPSAYFGGRLAAR